MSKLRAVLIGVLGCLSACEAPSAPASEPLPTYKYTEIASMGFFEVVLSEGVVGFEDFGLTEAFCSDTVVFCITKPVIASSRASLPALKFWAEQRGYRVAFGPADEFDRNNRLTVINQINNEGWTSVFFDGEQTPSVIYSVKRTEDGSLAPLGVVYVRR